MSSSPITWSFQSSPLPEERSYFLNRFDGVDAFEFQSSPLPEERSYQYTQVWFRFLFGFNPLRSRRSGATGREFIPGFVGPGFNPLRSRRSGATDRSREIDQAIQVSILSAPGGAELRCSD